MISDHPNHRTYQKVTQICPNGVPQIHFETFKDPSEYILALNDHQTDAKFVFQDPKMLQQLPPKTSKKQ